MTSVRKRFALLATLIASVGLAACGETERPLSYQPGVYGGAADEPLSSETVDALRQRTNLQR